MLYHHHWNVRWSDNHDRITVALHSNDGAPASQAACQPVVHEPITVVGGRLELSSVSEMWCGGRARCGAGGCCSRMVGTCLKQLRGMCSGTTKDATLLEKTDYK